MTNSIGLLSVGDISGGIRSFTVHLGMLLEMYYDCECTIFNVRDRSEYKFRYKSDGTKYMNKTAEDLLKMKDWKFIVTYFANYKNSNNAKNCEKLLSEGIPIVIHDPRGTNGLTILDTTVCISRTLYNKIRGMYYAIQPYVMRKFKHLKRKRHAVCLTRIDNEKHTDIVCEANEYLPDAMKIDLYGIIDSMYNFYNLKKKFPTWKESYYKGTHESVGLSARELYSRYYYAVDLSTLKGDGGRTQYAFMEAMEAGSCLVINKDWLSYRGDMKDNYNCVSVDGCEELVDVLNGEPIDLSEGYNRTLERHGSLQVAEEWMEIIYGS